MIKAFFSSSLSLFPLFYWQLRLFFIFCCLFVPPVVPHDCLWLNRNYQTIMSLSSCLFTHTHTHTHTHTCTCTHARFWSYIQPGLKKICTSVRHRFMYLTTHFAAVSKRNVHWVVLKHVLEICPTPDPTLNLPDSVNKCKTDIKTYLLMQLFHFNFLELLCRTVITQDSNLSTSLYSVSYRTYLLSMKTHKYEARYVQC